MTTRSHEYELGEAVDLSLLSERDAFELLTARRAPADAAERPPPDSSSRISGITHSRPMWPAARCTR